MQLSIVIPLLNEEDSLPELHQWIVAVMQKHNYSYELIFVDDGSTDNSWKIIQELKAQNPCVKGIKFLKNFGKSQGLNAGFKKAQGEVIITM
ncbi:MAG: glycosyltransferase, partial [Wenyingzhuangia sp.]